MGLNFLGTDMASMLNKERLHTLFASALNMKNLLDYLKVIHFHQGQMIIVLCS